LEAKRHYARSRQSGVTEWVGVFALAEVVECVERVAGCIWCSTVEFTVGENSDERIV
jgi:hypothetical protein